MRGIGSGAGAPLASNRQADDNGEIKMEFRLSRERKA
jgi:hypothetical protein